jgi:serine protease AprX
MKYCNIVVLAYLLGFQPGINGTLKAKLGRSDFYFNGYNCLYFMIHLTRPPLLILLILAFFQHATGSIPGVAEGDPLQSYIVVLRNQEQASIAQEVKAAFNPQLQGLEAGLRILDQHLSQSAVNPKPLSRAEESAASQTAGQPPPPEQQARRQEILSALSSTRAEMRQEIVQRSAASRQSSQQTVAQAVSALGGEVVYFYETLNAVAVRITPQAKAALESLPEVQEVAEDQFLQAELDVSAHAIGAETFWNAGYTGGGVHVAVIDSGIDHNHPALQSQSYIGKRCLNTADIYYPYTQYNDPTKDDVNGHGTHVGGIVASTDNQYRGVAYGLGMLINGKAGFSMDGMDGGQARMYTSDAMSCVNWALTGGPAAEVINLSFGGSTLVDDGLYEQFWDAVVNQMGATVAIAAGNNGPSSCSGTGRLSSPSIAYNVISVANVDDKNNISRSNDIIHSSSSCGPTPGGRKKPDLAAPGTNINSTDNSWDTGGGLFIEYTGTSMASPHVAGAAALVMSRGVSDPMAVKALLINTAEDKGNPGWDAKYGWGYIDLDHASAHVSDVVLDSIPASPAYRFYAGPALSGDAATLVWERRAVYNGANFPSTHYTLTNLDLFAYDEDSGAQVANSLSQKDNVEQVRFSSPLTQTVVKVDAVSTSIDGAGVESYAMATEDGFTLRSGPVLQLYPFGVGDLNGPVGSLITVTLLIGNRGDLKAHDISINMDYSSGLELKEGLSLPFSVADLAVGELSAPYTWAFTKLDGSPQTLTFGATSLSYGEVFTATLGYQSSAWLPYISR